MPGTLSALQEMLIAIKSNELKSQYYEIPRPLSFKLVLETISNTGTSKNCCTLAISLSASIYVYY